MKSELENRFSVGFEVESVLILCSVLSPRFKSLPFLSEEKKAVVRDAIKTRFQRDIQPSDPVAHGAESDSDSQNNTQDYEPKTKCGRINQDDMSFLLGEYYETDCEIVSF